MWLRFKRWYAYRAWQRSQEDVGLNEETAELIRFTTLSQLPAGQWLVKRTLTLPNSTTALAWGIRISQQT